MGDEIICPFVDHMSHCRSRQNEDKTRSRNQDFFLIPNPDRESNVQDLHPFERRAIIPSEGCGRTALVLKRGAITRISDDFIKTDSDSLGVSGDGIGA